jgi:hypothetical protein
MNATTERNWESIQLFGVTDYDGKCLSYSGDPWAESLTVRDSGSSDEREAVGAELLAIRINIMAGRYLDREVLANQSCLVTDLMERGDVEGFEIDDIEGLIADPSEWTAEQCREYLDDEHNGSGDYPLESNPFSLDRAEIIAELEALGTACYDEESDELLAEALLESVTAGDWGDVDDWRDAVRDVAEPKEVYEWWLVSSYLAGELSAIGEPIIDNGAGYWWGRTCTGQAIKMDGTLQEIAAKHVRT